MAMRQLLICVLILVAACGSEPTWLGTGPSDSPPAASDPRGLLGTWTVAGTGVRAGTTLSLRDSSSIDEALAIDMPCGRVGGTWAAAGEQSLFAGDVYAGSGACFGDKGIRDVGWLRLVAGFRVGSARPELLGSDGAVVVTLSPVTGAPTATPGQGVGQGFAEPAPLPKDARAPTAEELQRRWVAVGTPPASQAFAAFADDRRWQGSDGCNRSGGQFVLGRDGRLLATNGPTTLVGCMGSALPYWVTKAGRVGLVDGQLVFYDRTAKELGRARPG